MRNASWSVGFYFDIRCCHLKCPSFQASEMRTECLLSRWVVIRLALLFLFLLFPVARSRWYHACWLSCEFGAAQNVRGSQACHSKAKCTRLSVLFACSETDHRYLVLSPLPGCQNLWRLLWCSAGWRHHTSCHQTEAFLCNCTATYLDDLGLDTCRESRLFVCYFSAQIAHHQFGRDSGCKWSSLLQERHNWGGLWHVGSWHCYRRQWAYWKVASLVIILTSLLPMIVLLAVTL